MPITDPTPPKPSPPKPDANPQPKPEPDPSKIGENPAIGDPNPKEVQVERASAPKPGQADLPKSGPKSDAQQHQQKSGHGQQRGTKPHGPRK